MALPLAGLAWGGRAEGEIIASIPFDPKVNGFGLTLTFCRSLGSAGTFAAKRLGLSGVMMVVAAFGYIPPAIGALLQEALDVTVILNALRAR